MLTKYVHFSGRTEKFPVPPVVKVTVDQPTILVVGINWSGIRQRRIPTVKVPTQMHAPSSNPFPTVDQTTILVGTKWLVRDQTEKNSNSDVPIFLTILSQQLINLQFW